MLTDQQLDEAYTHACHTMTAVGAAQTELYLARLALLLMKEVGDAPRIHAAIDAAKQGL
jgi:hypothetical protein